MQYDFYQLSCNRLERRHQARYRFCIKTSILNIISLFYPKRAFLLLPLLAFFYYGYYYRCGLYPSGEGGVEGVTALRLLSGKIPIQEVALNYNVLWFYPFVWLFKIFGPSYTIIRIFFFSLCAVTSILAYSILWQISRRTWLALLAGTIVLILPGQLFRNYMAFIVMLNMAFFLKAYPLPCQKNIYRFFWMLAAGFSLGLALLIRVDVGFFLAIILFGLIIIFPFCHEFKKFRQNLIITFIAFILAITGVFSLHWPVYQNAVKRGFGAAFLQQYEAWPHMINAQGSHLIHHTFNNFSLTISELLALRPSSKIATADTEQGHQEAKKTGAITVDFGKNSKTVLARSSFTSIDIRERLMALNLYLPIYCTALITLLAAIFCFSGVKNNTEYFRQRGVILLASLGCSLTLFPQYFFWRPDMIHLSEFMVPMNVTLLMTLAFAYEAWSISRWLIRCLLIILFLTASSTLILYLITGAQSQSTGGIAISEHRSLEFHGKNGVSVKLTPNEFEETSAIYQSIMAHSAPNEYVICFPYNPEINFMTDRPSYRRDLYIDNITAPKNFDQNTIQEIEKHQPAAIVINNWPINGTEDSRFKNWAAETYSYIQTHYILDYEKGIIQVFVRPDKI